MIRVILAGFLGGVVVFFCGFIDHEVFGWGEPKGKLPNDEALIEFLKGQKLDPDLYFFPQMSRGLSEEQQKKLNERYKQGPSGLLLIVPPGEDVMPPWKLIFEAASNIGVAFIAAWILAQLMPGTGLFQRWRIVLLLGVFAWLSVSASYAIWYRFPWEFIRDELFCALFEWGVAGLVIAAIVKPQPAAVP